MKKLFSWFGLPYKKKTEASADEAGLNGSPTPSIDNPHTGIPQITGIEWIDNDGLLRDEGVLFGIAQADHAEKLNAIKNGFEKARAPFEAERNQLIELIKNLVQKKEQNRASVSELRIQVLELEKNSSVSTHKALPMFLQLVAYVGICYFNYFLVVFWLQPVFDQGSLIPLGLYVFGMLSVFMGKALVYNSNPAVQEGDDPKNIREKWKIWLEELGVPLVVAAFITVLSFRSYPVEWSMVAFLLFFFLFSFPGKGLVNSLYRAHKEGKQLLQHGRAHWKKKMEIRNKKKEIKTREREIKETSGKIEEVQAKILKPDTKLNELNALLTYKVNIFVSEYNLASEAKEQLSAKQVASF